MSHEEEGGGHDERWVISYADLVTLLLGFFIILYASAEVDMQRFEQLSAAFSQAFNVDVNEGSGSNDGSTVFDAGSGFMQNGTLESLLEDIPGLGPARRRELLKSFGGLQGVRQASVEDLAKVRGISRPLAESIFETMNPGQ